jgi:cysteine desulfurase
MADKIIYLDNAATTVVNEEALEAYSKAKKLYFANPGSIHIPGQEASRLLEKAREQILQTLKVKNDELIFVSGATEANNLAIKGYCLKHQNRGKHIIVSNVEHPSVLEVVKQLEEYFGFEVTYLHVNNNGIIEIEDLKKAIRKDTILVSIMAVNNEIGTVNPIHDIAMLLKDYPLIVFHSDVTQGIGKIDLPYDDIDMFSFSGHKIHGLNSSGALIKRKKIELLPLLSGGGQENGVRSGTNDVALAVSLAKAIRLEFGKIVENYRKIVPISQYFKDYLLSHQDLYELNSGDNPYIINFSLLTKKASVVVEALSARGIMVSSVSACHAKEEPISYVVQALGKNDLKAHNTIRVSLAGSNTLDDIKALIENLESIIGGLK